MRRSALLLAALASGCGARPPRPPAPTPAAVLPEAAPASPEAAPARLVPPLRVLGDRCPAPEDLLPEDEIVELPAGCSAPFAGWLYSEAAYAENAAELQGLAELVQRVEARLQAERVERTAEQKRAEEDARLAASTIRGLRASLKDLGDPPSRAVWFGWGSLAGGAAVAALVAALVLVR